MAKVSKSKPQTSKKLVIKAQNRKNERKDARRFKKQRKVDFQKKKQQQPVVEKEESSEDEMNYRHDEVSVADLEKKWRKSCVDETEKIKKVERKQIAKDRKNMMRIDNEDEVIQSMGRKLKLHKRRKNQKAIPRSFYEDGLGDLLEFIENPSGEDPVLKDGDDEQIEDKDDELKDEESSNDEEDELDGEDEVDDEDEDEDESENDIDEEDEESEKEQTKEDIYGRKLDKKGQPVVEKKVTFAETSASSSNELDNDLLRLVRGQINRLTSSNLPSIASLIQNLYSKNSLFQVNECVCKCIDGLTIVDVAMSPQKLVCELSLLVATLQVNVGDEVAGHAIHYFIKIMDDLLKSINDEIKNDSKKLDNLILLFCYFYAASIIDSNFMFELVNQILNNLNEKTIELLMTVLISVGFIFRKDSPIQMKKLIELVNKKANEVTSSQVINNKRVEFMLETLAEIRNNNILKVTSKSSGVIVPIEREDLKNILKNCLKKSNKVTPLAVTYNQALASNRWWIKVGALKELKQDSELEQPNQARGSKRTADEFILEGDREDKLCRFLRLNTTPLKRSLFKALITSSDIVEAANRMITICNKQQSSEATNVILQVALHEATFNPFYVHLLARLSNFDRKFKVSTHFTVMDKISHLETMNDKVRKRFVEIIVQLLIQKVISLTILKKVEFSDLNDQLVDFVKSILTQIMSQEDENVMKSIFERIPAKEAAFSSSIRLFISCFMDEKSDTMGKQLIKARIKLKKPISN